MLLDLDVACRKSGLKVITLPNWKRNASPGGEFYGGISIHHTGAYDSLTDATNDYDYAMWMAFGGRDDLDPPLMNLALSAESVVYVGAAGNANGVGYAKASGPMPERREGNGLYVVIEAMNSGSQGWDSVGKDAAGNPVTQLEGYHRLCAAICRHYRWSAETVRAHYETSVTGKWDPGDPDGVMFGSNRVMDMRKFRAAVARLIDNPQEDDMPYSEKQLTNIIRGAVKAEVGDELERLVNQNARIRRRINETAKKLRGQHRDIADELTEIAADDGA